MKRVVSLFLAVILLLALVPATAVVEAEDTSASALTASPSQLEADIPDQDESELPSENETEEPVESGAEDGEEHEEDKTPPVIVAGGDVGTPEGENPAPGAEGGTALTATGRDYVLRVSGALPEDVSLEVREITDEKEYDRYAAQAAARVYAETEAETGPLPYARFFDITLRRADGTAYQPAEPVTVSVDLQDDALNTKGVAFAALHFPQSMPVKTGAPGKKGAPARQSGPELLEVTCGEEISFTAGSFSVYGVAYYYTVDFYYYGQKPEYYAPVAVGTIWSPQNTDGTPEEGAEEETVYEYLPTRPFDHDMTEHHIGGGSSILLSELLAQLDAGVAAQDVKKVEFTDPELVSVHARSDDYELTSLAPFTSFEYLYLTLDTGERVEISVADAVGPSGFGTGLEWLIEDDGTLVIRPATPGGAGMLPGASTTWAGGAPTNPTIAALANVWPWLDDAHRGQIKKIRIESGVRAPSNGQLRYMFYNCENLTDVDLSGLDMNNLVVMNDMFRGCTSLTTVDLSGYTGTLDKLTQIARMFRDCTALTSVNWGTTFENRIRSNVQQMQGLFQGCTSLTSLDLSWMGTLAAVTNMQNLVAGCDNLAYLDISNLNNSRVTTTNYRNLGLTGLQNLEIIRAENSKVRLNNAAGNTFFPGGDWILNTTGLTRDGERLVQADLENLIMGNEVTSQGGVKVSNLNGAGYLPAGTYVLYGTDGTPYSGGGTSGADFENVPETFYIIDNLAGAEYTIDIDPTKYDVYVEKTPGSGTYELADTPEKIAAIPGNTRVNVYTKEKTRAQWEDQSGAGPGFMDADGTHHYDGTPITLVYKQVVTDVNGQKHDLQVQFTNFDFHEVNEIPYGGSTTKETYPDADATGTRQFLFTAGLGRLILRNYLVNRDRVPTEMTHPNDPGEAISGSRACLTSSHGGTYASFNFTVPDAEPGSTILFFIEDLDVRHHTYGSATEQYGPGAEGIILGSGCELDTVTLSNNTKLRKYVEEPAGSGNWVQLSESDPRWNQGNYILGSAGSATGTDNLDPDCRFYVRSDATSSGYTWTSGTGCDTELLNPNGITGTFRDLKPLYLTPAALKHMDGLPVESGGAWDGQFTFELAYQSAGSQPIADENGVPILPAVLSETETETVTVTNNGSQVEFSTMEFQHPRTDPGNQYYIGTYIFEIKESDRAPGVNDNDLVAYDKTKRYLRVVLYNPENDAEMIQGFRAVVTAGALAPGATQITWDDVSTTVWSENEQYADSLVAVSTDALLVTYDGVKYYKRGSTGYEDESGNPLTIDPRSFFPSSSDEQEGGGATPGTTPGTTPTGGPVFITDPADGKTYPVMVDANGTRFYRKDGAYYDPVTFTRLEVAAPSMTIRTVNGYPLHKDRYGTNYYTPDNGLNYYAEDGTPLQVYTGTVDPAEDDELVLASLLDSGGHRVLTDVHGVCYWYDSSDPANLKYYKPDTNDPIKVENTVFNPVVATDKEVYAPKSVVHSGATYLVKRDSAGVEYYAVPGTDALGQPTVSYFRPDGTSHTIWSGDVDPKSGDEPVEMIKVKTEPVVDNLHGQPVYRDKHRVKYYKQDGKYYSLTHQELTPESGVFEPESGDQPVVNEYPVYCYEDEYGNLVEYYRKVDMEYTRTPSGQYVEYDQRGKYYRLNPGGTDTELALPHTVVDLRSSVSAGVFENRSLRMDLRINKITTDDKVGTFKFRVKFTGLYDPTAVFSHKDPDRVSFSTPAQGGRTSFVGAQPITEEPFAVTYAPVPGTGVPTPVTDGVRVVYQFSKDPSDPTAPIITVVIEETTDSDGIVTRRVWLDPDLTNLGNSRTTDVADLVFEPNNGKASFALLDGRRYTIDLNNGGLTISDNAWEFTLEENESVVFKQLPLGTEFEIWEYDQQHGWYLVEVNDKNGVIRDTAKAKNYAANGAVVTTDVMDKAGNPIGQQFTYRFSKGGGEEITVVVRQTTDASGNAVQTVWEDPQDAQDVTKTAPTLVKELVFDPSDASRVAFTLPGGTRYDIDLSGTDPDRGGKELIATPMATKAAGKIESVDPKDYEYTFRNQFTEVSVKKIVTGNLGHRGDVFDFTATFSNLKPGAKYIYAVEHEEYAQRGDTIVFVEEAADSGGTIKFPFKLQDGQSVYIVVPFGADMKVEELLTKAQKDRYNRVSISIPRDVTPAKFVPSDYVQERVQLVENGPLEDRWQISRERINPEEDQVILVENRADAAIPTEVKVLWHQWLILVPAVGYGVLRLRGRRRRHASS